MLTWTVLVSLTVLTPAYCADARYSQVQIHKQSPYGNQRIIKIHGPNFFNRFRGHNKQIRNRPTGGLPKGAYAKEEFIRPNHPPAIPPFYSANHVGHSPRPPPQIYQKSQTQGNGFPYKNLNNFRTSTSKYAFLKQKPSLVHPTSATQTEHVATTPETSQSQKIIRISQVPSFSQVSVAPTIFRVPSKKTETSTATASQFFPSYVKFSRAPSPTSHGILSDGDVGPIREVPAPNLGPKPTGSYPGHPEPDAYGATFGISGTDNANPEPLDVSNFLKDSIESSTYDANHVVQIPGAFYRNNGLDFGRTNLLKDGAGSEEHDYGYKVKEPQESNDKVIKGQDGTKFYYAPDPDPSLPVYKVPPTRDPHSTPSNGQNDIYVPQLPNGYSYPEGDSVSQTVATLSPQELYRLMQGYPTVLAHPLVTYVGQPKASNVLLSGSTQNYYQQSTGDSAEVIDTYRYLQNPQIHQLIHSAPKANYGQETITAYPTGSQLQESAYSPYDQYQTYLQAYYQPYYYADGQNFDDSGARTQYEPEMSETRSGPKYARQADEKTEKGKDDEGYGSTESNFHKEDDEQVTTEVASKVYQFKIAPEVPFYSSLPSETAAKTLAGLQAAGNVASKYLNRIKTSRGKDESKTETKSRVKNDKEDTSANILFSELRNVEQNLTEGKVQSSKSSRLDATESEDGDEIYDDSTESLSDSQESENLTKFEFKEKSRSKETFGKRIKPK